MMYSLLGLDENATLLKQINTAIGGTTTGPTTPPTTDPTDPTTPPTTDPTDPPAGDCGSVPAYVAGTVYNAGNEVSRNGRKYKAQWWTQNEAPGSTGDWGVWKDQGAC